MTVLGSGWIVSDRDKAADRTGEVAGVAAQTQDPGKAGDAHGGGLPRPLAENAKQAAEATDAKSTDTKSTDAEEAHAEETGETSAVASQLLWDGSSATSRIDEVIAEAEREDRG